MEDIKKIKEEILNREQRKHYEKKIMLELQIALQRKLNPEEISAKKPLRFAQNGQPISWEEVSRKKHIEMLEGELENVNQVLETIEEYYKL